GGFAAARWPQQHHEGAVVDRRIDAVEHLGAAETLHDRSDFDRRHRPSLRPPDCFEPVGRSAYFLVTEPRPRQETRALRRLRRSRYGNSSSVPSRNATVTFVLRICGRRYLYFSLPIARGDKGEGKIPFPPS